MNEQWKDVLGFPGYRVSSLGRVLGRRGHILKTFPIKGYLSFNAILGKTNRASLRVHREVLKAFSGRDYPELLVRHLDGNPLNCRLDNLKWGTCLDNEADKRAHGRMMIGERHHQAKLNALNVILIRGTRYPAEELADRFGVSARTIYHIRSGGSWKRAS